MSRSTPRRLAPVLLAAALGSVPAEGHAQPQAQDRHPTDGVDRVIHDVSSEGDANFVSRQSAWSWNNRRSHISTTTSCH